METFSALMTLCNGNPPITGRFSSQRPLTRSFHVFFDLLNKRLNKQSRRRWFETPSCSLWRHCNAVTCLLHVPASFAASPAECWFPATHDDVMIWKSLKTRITFTKAQSCQVWCFLFFVSLKICLTNNREPDYRPYDITVMEGRYSTLLKIETS